MTVSPAVADYDANAAKLAAQWRGIDPREVHAPILHLLPTRPSRIADLGAGAGGDAFWFAEQGHAVLAVEPAEGLRRAGMADYPSDRIEWLDDSLPDLASVMARGDTFDLVMISAVWAHLDHGQRARAMPSVAALVRPGGRLIMSVRNGWTPPSRPTWEARPEDTIRHAKVEGLELIFEATTGSVQAINRANGVTWTRLAFERASAASS